jgi:hypothetical protein
MSNTSSSTMYQERPTSNITLHATAVPLKKDKFVSTQNGSLASSQNTAKFSQNNSATKQTGQ